MRIFVSRRATRVDVGIRWHGQTRYRRVPPGADPAAVAAELAAELLGEQAADVSARPIHFCDDDAVLRLVAEVAALARADARRGDAEALAWLDELATARPRRVRLLG